MKILNTGIHAVKGVQSSAVHAGFKSNVNQNDLALIYFPQGATVAGLFTRNLVKAWPVLYDQALLNNHSDFKAILINSGNANACNGASGQETIEKVVASLAHQAQIDSQEILVCSTGVIGAPLAFEPFEAALPELVSQLQSASSEAVAQAILTTDTISKETAYSMTIDNQTVHIGGMAKGSGMIHPNLGTMLAFLTLDIDCNPELLHHLLIEAVEASFNSISVDGDTSTNDTVFLCATGETTIEMTDKNIASLQALITKACQDLAQAIIRDGEGASKFITVHVQGAYSWEDANKVAQAIATSNLVKTALCGEDPNWGRVLSAVGNSQVANIDPFKVDIYFKSKFGVVQPCHLGSYADFSQNLAKKVLSATDIDIMVNLNLAEAEAKIWTCDLTHDYIVINADYHT